MHLVAWKRYQPSLLRFLILKLLPTAFRRREEGALRDPNSDS
jgi:hypothetical protein